MKKIFSIASAVVGFVGLGVFFNPLIEGICGVGGLILGLIGKDKKAGGFIKAVRSWGVYLAWINILWVCAEMGLKFAGIKLF